MHFYHNAEEIARIHNILDRILSEYYSDNHPSKVIAYGDKQDLLNEFSRAEAPAAGIGLDATLQLFRDRILPRSVKTWHPRFLNQMFAGAPFAAILGDYLASMMNPTLATWEVAPVATIIERNVVQWMAQLLGMPKDSSGIFLPGSSLANLVALTVARNQRLSPAVSQKGLKQAPQGAIICSTDSHYSVANAANILGIGRDHLIRVRTDARNEMVVSDLEEKLKKALADGIVPFAAVATIGSTVTGGVDPVPEIARLCKAHNIHLHVDAAFGGGMSLTSRAHEILAGVEDADSICWDAHKSLQTPLTSTVLIFPDVAVLKETFDSGANYLFHPQDGEAAGTDDLGQYTPLCGKRFDALKLWVLWNTYGTAELRANAEARLEVTDQFYRVLEDDPDFQPSFLPKTPLQCFRYIPAGIAGAAQDYQDRLHRWVRDEAKRRGIGFFNIAALNGAEHFRTVLINPLTTIATLAELLEDIRRLGEEYIAGERPL